MAVLLLNPLKVTLAHYEQELSTTLRSLGLHDVESVHAVAGDGISGPLQRLAIIARSLYQRFRLGRQLSGQVIIVLWPLFGYFEPLTLGSLARNNRVYVIVHDPSPLRRSYGQSVWARRSFKFLVQRIGIHVLYHTVHAQQVGARTNGVNGRVVPHPIALAHPMRSQKATENNEEPVVRVLGQYKATRSLLALERIGEATDRTYRLEVYGRGWPAIAGWSVENRFVPEDEFTSLLQSSDCIVIPYESFFQSGVAVRCLEEGIPVVAPEHEHIAQLYGSEWAGMVRHDTDWPSAIANVLVLDPGEISIARSRVSRDVQQAWKSLLTADTVSLGTMQ